METFICCDLVVLRLDILFTNAAWHWIIQKKKKKREAEEEKKIKIALSLGYPNSYFFNKRCNMLL